MWLFRSVTELQRHTYQCWIEQRLITGGPTQALNLQMKTGAKRSRDNHRGSRGSHPPPHINSLMSRLCSQTHTPTPQGGLGDRPSNLPLWLPHPLQSPRVPFLLLQAPCCWPGPGSTPSLGMVVVLFVEGIWPGSSVPRFSVLVADLQWVETGHIT